MDSKNMKIIGIIAGVVILVLGGIFFINRRDKVDVVDETQLFEIIGEVIKMEPGSIDILEGDVAQSFTVEDSLVEDIYLGETVKATHDGVQIITIEKYMITDFDVTYDSNGNRIYLITGMFMTQRDGDVILVSGKDEFSLQYDGTVIAEKGDEVTFAYVEIGGKKIVIDFYNESNSMMMTIEKIEKAMDGSMKITASDDAGVAAIINPTTARKNFNLSELRVGDKIDVFTDIIQPSEPMQITPKRIMK